MGLSGVDGTSTTTGPVKIADNAASGACSCYTAGSWYYIDKEGFAWYGSKTNMTKNTVAGAIFGDQGSTHSSFNYTSLRLFAVIPS